MGKKSTKWPFEEERQRDRERGAVCEKKKLSLGEEEEGSSF